MLYIRYSKLYLEYIGIYDGHPCSNSIHEYKGFSNYYPLSLLMANEQSSVTEAHKMNIIATNKHYYHNSMKLLSLWHSISYFFCFLNLFTQLGLHFAVWCSLLLVPSVKWFPWQYYDMDGGPKRIFKRYYLSQLNGKTSSLCWGYHFYCDTYF